MAGDSYISLLVSASKNFAWGLFLILPFSVLISGYYMAIAKTHAHHLFAFLLHGASIGLIFEYAMTIIRTVIWDVRDMRECSYTEETIADLEMLYEGRTALCLDADDWESARWIRGRNGYVLKLKRKVPRPFEQRELQYWFYKTQLDEAEAGEIQKFVNTVNC